MRCWAISDWTQFANRAPWCDEPAVAAELPDARCLALACGRGTIGLEVAGLRSAHRQQRRGGQAGPARLDGQPRRGRPQCPGRGPDRERDLQRQRPGRQPARTGLAGPGGLRCGKSAGPAWHSPPPRTNRPTAPWGISSPRTLNYGWAGSARADEHAVNAINLFARFRAGNLGQLAELTRIHIALESGQPAGPVAPSRRGKPTRSCGPTAPMSRRGPTSRRDARTLPCANSSSADGC